MFEPPPGHAVPGKWATLPSGASKPSPSMIFRSIPKREITIRFATMACGEAAAVGEADASGDPTAMGRLEIAEAGYEAEGVAPEGVATEVGPAVGVAANGQL